MKLLTFLVTILLALPVCAADKVAEHDIITIVPGKPWSLIVRMTEGGATMQTQGNRYIAYVTTAPPMVEQTLVTFNLAVSAVEQGALMLSLTPQQSKAMAGKSGRWIVAKLLDIGNPQVIIRGKIEVKP